MSKFSVTDYKNALKALMPPGVAWSFSEDDIPDKVLAALGAMYAYSDTAAQDLIRGAFPGTATILLQEWEDTLALPDLCSISESTSITSRQAAVTSRLVATGGQSIPYFISVCASLGYTVTVTEHRRAVAGKAGCGAALNGDDWPWVWTINAPQTTITMAKAGRSYAGDPLATWGNKTLECKLKQLAPAHAILQFSYTS